MGRSRFARQIIRRHPKSFSILNLRLIRTSSAGWFRVLDIIFPHLLGNVVGLTDRQGNDRQGRIFTGAGGELAAV